MATPEDHSEDNYTGQFENYLNPFRTNIPVFYTSNILRAGQVLPPKPQTERTMPSPRVAAAVIRAANRVVRRAGEATERSLTQDVVALANDVNSSISPDMEATLPSFYDLRPTV